MLKAKGPDMSRAVTAGKTTRAPNWIKLGSFMFTLARGDR
jgi:hypothetical protein